MNKASSNLIMGEKIDLVKIQICLQHDISKNYAS